MKPRRAILLLVAACFGCLASPCAAQNWNEKRPFIPQIARLLGVRVGYNGQNALVHRLGKGICHVSGHPNSRQTWRTRSPGGAIVADGFSLNDEGYVIEELEWTVCDSVHSDPSIPWARRLPKRSGWLGIINLGMTAREVARLTEGKLPPPVKQSHTWIWKQKGFMPRRFEPIQDAYQQWTATLDFVRGRLASIQIECE